MSIEQANWKTLERSRLVSGLSCAASLASLMQIQYRFTGKNHSFILSVGRCLMTRNYTPLD
ncbi:MAG: hypothetical protein F4X92_03090 [Gammaproteobacteria bacterium]|nr:hypothetical protein [Gammaproteobacteria bacterium]